MCRTKHLQFESFKNSIISFWPIATADLDVLFTAVHPPPKGVSRVVFCDGSDDPITVALKIFWDSGRPASADSLSEINN
jgi:hypothetical protein